MILVWGDRAKRDFRELVSYIAEASVQTADLVASRIDNAAEMLTFMPRMGRKGRVAGTHELVVPRTPYILAYRIQPGAVRILRVMRGARRWPSRFD